MAESRGFHLLSTHMDPGLCRLLLLLHKCYLGHNTKSLHISSSLRGSVQEGRLLTGMGVVKWMDPGSALG